MAINKMELGGILNDDPKVKEEKKRLNGGEYAKKFKTTEDVVSSIADPEELLMQAEEAGLKKGEVEKQIREILEDINTTEIEGDSKSDYYETGYEEQGDYIKRDSELGEGGELGEEHPKTEPTNHHKYGGPMQNARRVIRRWFGKAGNVQKDPKGKHQKGGKKIADSL